MPQCRPGMAEPKPLSSDPFRALGESATQLYPVHRAQQLPLLTHNPAPSLFGFFDSSCYAHCACANFMTALPSAKCLEARTCQLVLEA